MGLRLRAPLPGALPCPELSLPHYPGVVGRLEVLNNTFVRRRGRIERELFRNQCNMAIQIKDVASHAMELCPWHGSLAQCRAFDQDRSRSTFCAPDAVSLNLQERTPV